MQEAEICSVRLFVKSSIIVEIQEISQASFKYRYQSACQRSSRFSHTTVLISLSTFCEFLLS